MSKFRRFEIQASEPFEIMINLDHIINVYSVNGYAQLHLSDGQCLTTTIEYKHVTDELSYY